MWYVSVIYTVCVHVCAVRVCVCACVLRDYHRLSRCAAPAVLFPSLSPELELKGALTLVPTATSSSSLCFPALYSKALARHLDTHGKASASLYEQRHHLELGKLSSLGSEVRRPDGTHRGARAGTLTAPTQSSPAACGRPRVSACADGKELLEYRRRVSWFPPPQGVGVAAGRNRVSCCLSSSSVSEHSRGGGRSRGQITTVPADTVAA